jgi:hypothetical protein
MFGDNSYNGTTISSKREIDTLLRNALKLEREYKWHEAVNLYQRAIKNSSEPTVSSAAQTWEKIGFCYNRASRQAVSLEEFKKYRRSAEEAYRHAAQLLDNEEGLTNQAKREQCRAVAEYIGSWLSSTPQEKREKLYKCRVHGNRSLKAYEDAGDNIGYGIMCNYLLSSLFDSLYIASDWSELMRIKDEGKKCIDKAIAVNTKIGTQNELVLTFSLCSLLAWYVANISEREEERNELMQKSLSYSEKALELSGDVDDPYTSAILYWAAAFNTLLFTKNVESSKDYAQKMLEHGDSVRDNYLKGVASYVLAWATNWMIVKEDDTDKKKQGHERVIKYAQDAINYLQLVSHDMYIAQAYWVYAESCSNLADDIVISSVKMGMIDRAIDVGREGLEHARFSGSPDATGATLHALSKALHLSSNFHTGRNEKIKLLEEALDYREEYNDIVQKMFPYSDFTCGVGLSYKGLLEAEMARIEVDPITQIALLEKAIADMERSVSLCGKAISSRPVPTQIAVYGRYQNSHGEFLDRLYSLTEEKKNLRKAIEVYEDAAKKYKEINLPSRAAESYWKRARDLDLLGENKKAAADFEKAFTEYEDAAKRIPHFTHLFLDYASYMKAWSNIERARYHHSVYQYDKEHEFYQNAAILHEKTKRWKYLGITYYAWAKLAEAEDLSRKEHTIEARDLFKEAADLFSKGKISIEAEIESIDDNDEKEMAQSLIKASEQRRDYCLGRATLEEARILDRQGDNAASSRKYDDATQILQNIADSLDMEPERKELLPIISLCKAWKMMTLAEAEASPERYHEAALLFEEAKDHSVTPKSRLLALGHSNFCRALYESAQFEATRDMTVYQTTNQYLTNAANYYMRAGYEAALEYSNATQRLFDAYVYMNYAKSESDPEKKARHYMLAERVLEASADSYLKAKYPEKRAQVNRLLDNVRQERKFALSLLEVLQAPLISSSTASFVSPTPTHEYAVGLESFEHANIHANLYMKSEDIKSGEKLEFAIELYNTGTAAASMVKVEGVIPDNFKVVRVPGFYRIVDNYLDMKGKKLGPLGTEEIAVTLKPLTKGEYTIKPRIVYLDDTGKYKSCEPEPANITVTEMGILDWIRGPRERP